MNLKKINWKKFLDKKYWKIYAAILLGVAVVVTTVVLIVGTSKREEPDVTTPEITSPETTTPSQTTPEETTPGTEEPPIVQKTVTSVTITAGSTPAEVTAVNDLKKYLTKKGVTVADDGEFPITLSIDENLGADAFCVTAVVGEDKEESLAIVGGNGRGVLYGVYQFLEKYADVRFFTPTFEVCEAGEVSFPDGVLLNHTPVLEMRQTDWYNWMDETQRHTWAAKVGVNIMSGWKRSWDESLGGSLSYAPSMFVHTLGKLSETGGGTSTNPCLTDEKIYSTVLANVRKILAEDPDTRIFSVSQNDSNNYCKCENCAAIDAEEGSPAGTLLRFVNRIANDIAADYPNVTVDTLAYKYTLNAPKVTKPAPNVCIRLSTISCHLTHPITKSGCSTCANFRVALEKWSAICDNIYIWDYTTNYAYYLATFPNFHVLRENMKYFADHNVKGVYEQGNASGPSGEFGELRAYLISKLLMNPYMSKTEYYNHMDEFLAAYYGDGWEYIRKYIDAYTQFASISPSGMTLYNYPFGVLSKTSLESLEETFNGWWDAAEAAAGDRLEYVQRSRWQLRYLLLYIHPDLETATKFAAEVEGAGTKWSERNPKLLWYAYEYDLLALEPDKWFTDPTKNK